MRLFFALFTVILSVSPYLSAQPAGKKIVILHTNDLHSHITGCAPESDYTPLTVNDDNTRGGFARIASIFKEEKGGEGEITLVLDGGDFLMGTLFQGVELTTGFQLPLKKEMGYDVVAIGNHEFDWGPDKLAEIIDISLKSGEIPQLMLSNAVFDPVDRGDDRLAALFDKGIITRKTVIEREGVKIGFFSILGKVADSNAAFAPPVTFADQVKTAMEMTKQLEGEGCDIIICLSHSGVATDKRGRLRGEDYKLAKKVKGIDVVISGHTHTTIDKPLMVNGVPIVQTGAYGRNVGRLELILRDGEIRVSDYRLIAVDDRILGDSAVNRLVEAQKERISDEILAPLGLEYDTKIAETGFLLSCDQSDVSNSNIGRMVADAIYSYVNNHDPGGTDIAMVAAGVIRDDIVPGAQTASDIFRVMSMGMGEDDLPGYPLSKVFLTGKEL
ncbi:MAG: bifunctional UDP-sugar hydrolase/5'-nucleotidase, partial [Bacteroidota bacterium]|nr:bifunctional UDP-sugar hydrolase/5'-nucleotidase [Bacteroidota bacterium]